MASNLKPCKRCGGKLKLIDETDANIFRSGIGWFDYLGFIVIILGLVLGVPSAIGGWLGGAIGAIALVGLVVLTKIFWPGPSAMVQTFKCRTCGGFQSVQVKTRSSESDNEV